AEEQERGRDGHPAVAGVGEAGVLAREDAAGERPDEQREDDEPAPVDRDPDTGDAPERDVPLVHRLSDLRTPRRPSNTPKRTCRAVACAKARGFRRSGGTPGSPAAGW